MNVNKVFLLGRVTSDPQIRKTPSGYSVTNFNIATNRVWTSKTGARQQETEFHNVVVWGRQAEVACQFLNKGSLVFVEGRLRTRNWQNKNGESRYVTEIICERLQLGPKMEKNIINKEENQLNEATEMISVQEEDVPVIDLEEIKKEELKEDDLPF